METDHTNRKLAAILAADVVGYSRLMANDETGTLAALNWHRENTFNPAVATHRGRIVKLIGDGTLVEFASVIDAVNCATAIQQSKTEAGIGPKIILRIGINLGDIITQDDDIYGNGVNIAARLEALARPGGICISSVVDESTRDRIKIVFSDGGEVNIKNIDRPVKVRHWHPQSKSDTADQKSDTTDAASPASITENPSIAVLPFDNMSGDADQEYFSDGISEDIITDLSRVSGLMVIARNSSFAYKGKSLDLRKVAQELGVKFVLEGSVRRAGNRVRITAQLIDATIGSHLWAERYDRDLTDIFEVQDEVTLKIVDALKVRLTPAEKTNITDIGTLNVEAHDHFLRLRNFLHWPGLTGDIWRRAIEHGERAIQLDSNYTQAYALLAIMHVYDFHNHWSNNQPDQALAKAVQLANQATELDERDPTANHAVAVVARWSGNYSLAASAIETTLSTNCDNAVALFTRSEILIGMGKSKQAIADLERAIRLDPEFSHQYLQFLGMAHQLLGHYETAALMFRERIQLVNNTDIGRAWLASTLGHLGQVAEAQDIWAELIRINPDFLIRPRIEKLAFVKATDRENVLQGLLKAGLPTD